MAAMDRWVIVRKDGSLLMHEENDGRTFLNRGAEAEDERAAVALTGAGGAAGAKAVLGGEHTHDTDPFGAKCRHGSTPVAGHRRCVGDQADPQAAQPPPGRRAELLGPDAHRCSRGGNGGCGRGDRRARRAGARLAALRPPAQPAANTPANATVNGRRTRGRAPRRRQPPL